MSLTLGVCWGAYAGKVTREEHIALLKKYGFKAVFLGSEANDLDNVVHDIQNAGIVVDNFHAPFDGINKIWKDCEEGETMANRLYQSVESCARLNVPRLIVHLSSGLTPPHVNSIGHARWKKLMELAEEKNVTICYENQRKLSNLAYAFEEFPAARFCWDCGHEFCFTPGMHYMPIFGSKLSSLHIHDNNREFDADQHMVPGDADIDFDYVAEQIAQTDFEGVLMLELIPSKTNFYDEMSADEFFARAAKAGQKIIDSIDLKRARIQKDGK